MGTVLYEASYTFDFMLLTPLFLMVFALFMPKIIAHTYGEHPLGERAVKVFCGVGAAIAALFCLLSVMIEVSGYKNVVQAYRNGDYETVEGFVEDFHPMPYEGHSMESFTIGGVEFEYSDYSITQGYHNALSHGGVITGNGQHLRIGYVRAPLSGDNIIVYIEELE